MRQRRIKNLEEKLKACEAFIVYDAQEYKGHWRDLFKDTKDAADVNEEMAAAGSGTEKRLYMELGCGKGAFISELAKRNPEDLYLGFEIQQSAVAIAGKKLLEDEPRNIKLVNYYVDDLHDLFEENELDGIFLNFSDPWPKKRHAKRRLTHRKKLEAYRDVIKPGGFLEFKSDNDGLYEFTVEEMKESGYEISAMTTDLHNSPYMETNILTEYEEKFSNLGKNIYYIRVDF
jgi:tRNA (guanine-N7-)-methyltransferase